jgi:hypothetical protein
MKHIKPKYINLNGQILLPPWVYLGVYESGLYYTYRPWQSAMELKGPRLATIIDTHVDHVQMRVVPSELHTNIQSGVVCRCIKEGGSIYH